MSELVPEVRKDKRGKMVTRWVKKDAAGSSGAKKGIPQVKPSNDAKDAARRNRTINKLAKALVMQGYYDPDDSVDYTKETLSKFTSRSTFDVIDNALKHNPQRAFDIELAVSDYPEQKARDMIFFMEATHEDLQGNDRDALLAGLKSYDMFSGVEDFSLLKGKDLDAAVALVKVGSRILIEASQESRDAPHMFRWHITDTKLLDAVLSNLDRVDEITSFMEKRRVFDGEAVTSYLNEHTALNEGFL